MSHKKLQKLARKLRSKKDVEDGKGLFQGKGWLKRKKEIAERVKRKEAKAQKIAAKNRKK